MAYITHKWWEKINVYGRMLRQCGSSLIHADRSQRTEVKLRDIVRRVEGDGADLSLLWLNSAHSGQIHLGSSVHLSADITPEYKTPGAWKKQPSNSMFLNMVDRHRWHFFVLFSYHSMCDQVNSSTYSRRQIHGGLIQLKNMRWKQSCQGTECSTLVRMTADC